MNRGLWLKIWREYRLVFSLLLIGIFVFELIVSAVLPSFFEESAAQMLSHPFIRNILTALLGSEIGDKLSPQALLTAAWVHPVLLSLLWAHLIVFCTRMPVAEIDRGTADLWFALPVTRMTHYLTESFGCLLTGLLLLLAALAGHLLGSGDQHAPLPSLLLVVTNLYALYIATAGFAYLCSTLTSRRSRAIGLIFAAVLFSFFLSFLVPFWPPAKHVAFLGLLHYYRPLQVIAHHQAPTADILILLGLALLFWLLGARALRHRDLATL